MKLKALSIFEEIECATNCGQIHGHDFLGTRPFVLSMGRKRVCHFRYYYYQLNVSTVDHPCQLSIWVFHNQLTRWKLIKIYCRAEFVWHYSFAGLL